MGGCKKLFNLTHNINALMRDNSWISRSMLFEICGQWEIYQNIDQNIEDDKGFDHTAKEIDQGNQSHAEQLFLEHEKDEIEEQDDEDIYFHEG